MNDRVPFTRLRWAIFCTMMTTIGYLFAVNYLTEGHVEDDLIDFGLWIILFGQLFGLLMIFRGQRLMNRENTVRLERCENSINGYDQAFAFGEFFRDDDESSTLIRSWGQPAADSPAARNESGRAAAVLPFPHRESPR